MNQKSDYKHIRHALNLAKKNLGLTSPNPVVACVIVKNGEIIATGVTAKNGRPHAEQIAIEKIADKKILRDAELYVTLEPCAHFGQTPPCVDAIIQHGFKRVVIATKDVDSRVNGLGIAKLKQAGIEVECGVFAQEAQEINRGFFKAKISGKPFITLKIATSLDGKIATKSGDSKWITCEKSRAFAHHLRAINDAILVGANTVRKDNPKLDCRIQGLEDFSPKKFVISCSNNLDPKAQIFADNSTTILSTKKSDQFSNVVLCTEKNGEVSLNDALEKICQSGVNSLLVEGGSKIATNFLKENLVDELIWIRSNKIIGNDGIAAIDSMGFEKISDIFDQLKKIETRFLEDDVVEIYQSKNISITS